MSSALFVPLRVIVPFDWGCSMSEGGHVQTRPQSTNSRVKVQMSVKINLYSESRLFLSSTGGSPLKKEKRL